MLFQGREFDHRFFQRINRFLWAKEQFTLEKELIAPVALLSWVTWANRSRSLFCKERREWKTQVTLLKKANERRSTGHRSDSLLGIKRGQTVKNIRKIRIFQTNRSFFCEGFAQITSASLTSLFCEEQHERIIHIALLWRATRAKRSRLLYTV